MLDYRKRDNLLDALIKDDVEEDEEQGGAISGFGRRAKIPPLQKSFCEEAACKAGKSNQEETSASKAIDEEHAHEDCTSADGGEDGIHDEGHASFHAEAGEDEDQEVGDAKNARRLTCK